MFGSITVNGKLLVFRLHPSPPPHWPPCFLPAWDLSLQTELHPSCTSYLPLLPILLTQTHTLPSPPISFPVLFIVVEHQKEHGCCELRVSTFLLSELLLPTSAQLPPRPQRRYPQAPVPHVPQARDGGNRVRLHSPVPGDRTPPGSGGAGEIHREAAQVGARPNSP